ncbi:MAG: undecaprenyldiphospho-muramoylpentapeptide beta-N-acetylglucosaminyltransferase [Candidatus Paceibacterota bacterium]
MKILLTGGGTGGHFYPVIAVAEEIRKISASERMVEPKLYFMSDQKYDPSLLLDNNIIFKKIPAGKMRRYFSFLNFLDIFKTIAGIIKALFLMFFIMPDVVFGKGGYASFPALFAARLYGIPVVIHESDSAAGRLNRWAGKFAKRVAISFAEAAPYFPADKTAFTGNPIRKEITGVGREEARNYLKLEQQTPVILIMGGSQGSKIINETLISILPKLVEKYQIIHQAGENNIEEIKKLSASVLKNNLMAGRYHPFDYLNNEIIRMATSASDVVVSRAGSSIFEISFWGLPSILIPIEDSNEDHQRKNAFIYSASGAALVIEEKNLTGSVLFFDIERLLNDRSLLQKMSESARAFSKPDAAGKIAREVLNLALTHQR